MTGTPRRRKVAARQTRYPARACSETCRPLNPGSPHAHCTVCHRTFSGVGHFDRHRDNGRCDVSKTGLIERDGLWSTPEGHDKRVSIATRLANGRHRKDDR